MRTRTGPLVAGLAAGFALIASSASAQWYVAGALGVSHAQASTVVIDQPSRETHLDLSGVQWEAEPFHSPPYYFYRVGRLMGAQHQWGLEVEIVHPKMYAVTSAEVGVNGRSNGASIAITAPMAQYVTRYAMSHGMNLALGNVVLRRPLGVSGAVAVTARAGAGMSFPHAEVTMGGESVDQYEFGGLALQVGGGLDVRLSARLSTIVEYRLAYARPEIDVPGGTGRTTATIHQAAFGLRVGITK